jgi:hypothetical protein
MARKEHRFRNVLRESCIFILNSFLPSIMQVVQQASSEGNYRQVLQGARQGTDIIKFLHKLDFSLDLETVYRLLHSSESLDQEGLLPKDLKIFAGIKQALADSLLASCPSEPEQALEPAAANLADMNPELLRNLISKFSQSQDLAGFAPPASKWEKSGKKAKKPSSLHKNSKEYQQDSVCEKIGGKLPLAAGQKSLKSNPRPGLPCLRDKIPAGAAPAGQLAGAAKSSWVRDLDEGLLDIDVLNTIGSGRPYAELCHQAAAA